MARTVLASASADLEESTMHPNEQLARRELEVLGAVDVAALDEIYTDDVVVHYPGRYPQSGRHQTYREFLGKAMDLMGEGGTITRVLHDAFGSDEHAVQL